MMLANRTGYALAALALVLFAGRTAIGQRARGELRIEVRDAQGAAVPTQAELVSDANQFRRTFQVGADGRYVVQDPIALAAEFLKAFPTLENVLIESWQEGTGVGNPYASALPSRTYGLPRAVTSPIISCANRHCRDGGFDVSQDISEMVDEKSTAKEFVKVCLSNEGFPKRGKPGRDCINTLHYRLTLRYEPGHSPAT